MTINISQHILGLKGQRVNEIKLDDGGVKIVIHCSRDARRRAIDPATGQKGSINQHVRRQVNDIPLFGYPCVVEIELAQVYINKGERRIEGCDFVDKGCRFTHRFCRLISGLCSATITLAGCDNHLGRWI
ncbi:hypothetical protein [Kiloniella sp.]|uniref:hypothetical protein n=1 Tax=Kiloniella sp. TaxID=1938587 RepID=UPI003B0294DA